MRSTELALERYDSDKIGNGYLEQYDPILAPWRDHEIVLLELGIDRGGSLLLWRDYFPRGTIVGIDIRLPAAFPPAERIRMYQGSQGDPEFLSRVAREEAPTGFDIIVDDASHLGELTKTAFWHLFDHHLRLGGLYVIEDWGTGYWDDWPDGRSLDLASYSRPARGHAALAAKLARKLHGKIPLPGHGYGMVGFIKQLVDEQAAADVTRRNLKGKPARPSKFRSLTITPSLVFVRKAGRSRED
jgi:hypothetical protein